MFRQTHIRLTLLNSLVFIVLISILGSIIYFYTKGQLYQDVDHSLLESVESFQNKWQPKDGTIGDDQGPRQIRRDPRIMTLFWNEDQQLLVEQNRDFELFKDHEKLIQPKKLNKILDVEVEHFSFRYIAIQIEVPKAGKITVQFIRNINSEKELLDRLLLIILLGCGIGVICAVVSGLFLSWESFGTDYKRLAEATGICFRCLTRVKNTISRYSSKNRFTISSAISDDTRKNPRCFDDLQ